jgi:WXG100 family type VII secretion target
MRVEAFPMADVSNNLQTTEEGMQLARQAFQDKTTEFNGYLSSVNTQWADLAAVYAGHSANAFGSGIDAWEQQFTVVINNLVDMMDKMGVSIGAYKNAEETAADTAGAFAGGLPDFNSL